MDEVLACAPDAKIVLRIAFPVDMRTRGFTGHNYVNQYGEEMPSYSYASEAWFRYTAERVTEVVEAVGAYAPAAGHVIGYHIGAGDSGEWLGPYFWEAYIDCSPVNRQRFSAFLAERYGTDGALREAWDDPAVSLEDDLIPRRLPGTECLEMFHAYGAFEDRFLTGRKYRRYTDYLEYYNGLAAQRITALAALVKRLTGRRSLAMFFTGYHTEARLPHSGQYALHRILQSPDIDAICAPVSYDDRNEGGKGPSMGPIQSIEAFGKLWMDEADYRSPVRKAQGNSEVAGGLDTGGYCRSVEGLLEVAARQLGKCMVYWRQRMVVRYGRARLVRFRRILAAGPSVQRLVRSVYAAAAGGQPRRRFHHRRKREVYRGRSLGLRPGDAADAGAAVCLRPVLRLVPAAGSAGRAPSGYPSGGAFAALAAGSRYGRTPAA